MKESFTTQSPYNKEDLEGQCDRLASWLASGNTIHSMHPAMRALEIGYLNSRISDIRRKLLEQGKDIFKRPIWVKKRGKKKRLIEYSFSPFV